MKKLILLLFPVCLLCISLSAQTKRTEILLLGSDHLAQIYKKEYPNTDVLLPAKQKEIQEFTDLIEKYNPDMIMVEVLPEDQKGTDSLYALYLKNKLSLPTLENGRSEVYQLAFRLGKKVGLPRIYCVNAPGGTSQSVLDNGENIDLYKNETVALRKIVSEKYQALQKGTLSFKDFLTFVNQPETYNLIYHLRYITPARVVNGTFKNPDKMIDTAFVNPTYIGAELISVFKNRDYKIYSNIVTTQLAHTPSKILLIIGVAHIGSLKSIFRDDPSYKVVDAVQYLNR
jgi:hypothetical protein